MDVFEAIRGRRSVGVFKEEPVTRERIERMLEAAHWAPNHHLTEPWRFYVMTGDGRRALANGYADIAVAQARETGAEAADEAELRAKQGAKAYRAPVVIAVAAAPSDSPKIVSAEEFAAAHAAVQNMLLAAHALGLGAIWRSGEPMYHPLMHRALGLREGEQLVGLIYAGVPLAQLPARKRTPVNEKTVWIESDR